MDQSRNSIDLPRVNIVVTCTKRKRVPPTESLTLRDVVAADLEAGFEEWLDRLDRCCVKAVSARNLYAGDHWTVVQSLEDVASESGFQAVVWVCSAGYGLIGIEAKIKPYSATFSLNHPDTIRKWTSTNACRDNRILWWQLQEGWRGPDSSMPRSITEVAATDPESSLIVVASKAYMEAILRDVQRASRALSDPDLLCVISTGTRLLLGLESNLLPSKASMQRTVGGSLHSLNIRLARTILAESTADELRASYLGPRFSRRVAESLPILKYQREVMTDGQIEDYISDALTKDSNVSWSSLLRKLRDSGRACRQERFSNLYQSAKDKLVGNR